MATRRSSPAKESAKPALVIARVFDAPRKLVWESWIEAKRTTFDQLADELSNIQKPGGGR